MARGKDGQSGPEAPPAEKETRGATLYERINRVKRDVSRVGKTGTNQHFGYKFATESDISDSLRSLMAEHGVCLVYHGPEAGQIVIDDAGETRSQLKKWRYRINIRYELVNADNPAERETVWGYGEALDTEDKGHNKAITNAHKYVLMKVFDISTGNLEDDPDHVGHADGVSKGATATKRPSSPPPPTPPAPQAVPQPPAPAASPPGKVASAPGRAEGDPDWRPMGARAVENLIVAMGERGIALKDIRAGLYKRGCKDILKGKEHAPETWPAGIMPDIKKVLDAHPVLPAPTDLTRSIENLSRILRRAVADKWASMLMMDPRDGQPQDAEQAYQLLISSAETVGRLPIPGAGRLECLIKDISAGVIVFPTMDTVPF